MSIDHGKLLGCPFCGGSAGPFVSQAIGFFVACGTCDSQSSGYTTKSAAIEAWNTRVPAHGQPVVDGSELSHVMNAQPFADKNDARRVWQLFKDDVHVADAIRGIVAALTGANP